MRQLKAKDVTFEVTIESEDLDPRGNASGWGEPEDSEYLAQILERLERGDEYAWCCVRVTATWRDFRGIDTLGGCCLSLDGNLTGDECRALAEQTAKDHEMYPAALADLNRMVRDYLKDADTVRADLSE